MNHEILEFIKRRWEVDSNFMNGNCYYFALILCHRFPQLKIYYYPIEGHFVAGDGKEFYDWGGMNNWNISKGEVAFPLDDIEVQDPMWYERLIRDCVM